MADKISVLVAARNNSKYLAKFLFGYFANTTDTKNTELLVMINAHDTWNRELVQHFQQAPWNVQFYTENLRLGRGGLHIYLNELLTHATGDWIVYFCEDHQIIFDGWDEYIRRLVNGRITIKTEVGDVPKLDRAWLDPNQVWCLIPKFDNCGAVNQILSRGYVESLGGVLGRHGWIDSYINDVNGLAFGDYGEQVVRLDTIMFHDFTHDQPNPMSDGHLQSILSDEGRALPAYDSDINKSRIKEDADKVRRFRR